jgi:hypothetical protein
VTKNLWYGYGAFKTRMKFMKLMRSNKRNRGNKHRKNEKTLKRKSDEN